MADALLQSDCPTLELVARGKVRDVYRVDADSLLFVASDRISAFDVVLASGIPGKGKVLTQISLFWFNFLAEVCPNHLITADIDAMPASVQAYREQLAGRSMLVRSLEILPVEAIVRGYLAGSGWKEYRQAGTVCGLALPPGLRESERLPEPLYTPSTKAEQGDHDENIHPDIAAEILGAQRAAAVSEAALRVYQTAAEHARSCGIILADTKFEFGLDASGSLILADEVLTPDSSRFWPADAYEIGRGQASFDKQFIRDWLESVDFDKTTPIPLPEEVVSASLERYLEAYRRLTGSDLTLD